MSDGKDLRIADLLRVDAPAPRDPVFRVRVLERREQRRFQQRLYTMLAGLFVIVLISVLTIVMGAGALGTMGAVVAGAAVATAGFAFRGSLPGILRRFSL